MSCLRAFQESLNRALNIAFFFFQEQFIVKYDASAQSCLPTHTDQSILSGVLALNDPADFEGGGTLRESLNTSEES